MYSLISIKILHSILYLLIIHNNEPGIVYWYEMKIKCMIETHLKEIWWLLIDSHNIIY